MAELVKGVRGLADPRGLVVGMGVMGFRAVEVVSAVTVSSSSALTLTVKVEWMFGVVSIFPKHGHQTQIKKLSLIVGPVVDFLVEKQFICCKIRTNNRHEVG